MNIVDYIPHLYSVILNFILVTLNTWFGKLKFFNFKQGRMIPYEGSISIKVDKTRYHSDYIDISHKSKNFGIYFIWQN